MRGQSIFQCFLIGIMIHLLVAEERYKFSSRDLEVLRKRTRDMFYHAYNGYINHAYPHDELRPLTCDGVNTWGSYSLTLVDALDTLVVLGNYTEFERVSNILIQRLTPDLDVNASVFETNIRVVGGLLSAHLLSRRAGLDVEENWPCSGPLLKLAEGFAKRILPAFNTPTGMPYGTINLMYGVGPKETSETCTAGVGTFIVEFGALSRLTGNPVYENVAMKAMLALNDSKSQIGLIGNHIDVVTGKWTALDAGIGAGVDSYFEYLVKGANLLNLPRLMKIFREFLIPIEKYIKNSDWYVWVHMKSGTVTMPLFQSLEAFWPGLQTMVGDIENAYKTLLNYFEVWNQFGSTPEFYSLSHRTPFKSREGYPLRPELIESILYMYKTTKDPLLLHMGKEILHAIEATAKTSCGYATIKDVRDHTIENRMESFFLAETVKYLYLLFDPDNPLHNNGQSGIVRSMPDGRQCVLEAGGYIFNTEAHPIDPAALQCCHLRQKDDSDIRDVIAELDANLNVVSSNSRHRTSAYHGLRGRTLKRVQKWVNGTGEKVELPLMSCPVPPYHMKLNSYGEIFSEG